MGYMNMKRYEKERGWCGWFGVWGRFERYIYIIFRECILVKDGAMGL